MQTILFLRKSFQSICISVNSNRANSYFKKLYPWPYQVLLYTDLLLYDFSLLLASGEIIM